MQKSDSNRAAKSHHRKVQASTTLNRKYTKRPTKKSQEKVAKTKKSPQVTHFHDAMAEEMQMKQMKQTEQMEQGDQMMQSTEVGQIIQGIQIAGMMDAVEMPETEMVEPHPIQHKVNAQMRERSTQMQEAKQSKRQSKSTAKELKDQAIQKALSSASSMGETVENMNTSKVKTKSKKSSQMHFGFWRVMLALSCAATAVFAIAYFVNLNMPDISLRVAAMQTGMDPAYPNYIPRDYNVSSITSEDGKITMEFNNSSTGGSFTLIEEKSSWDTNALVSNFVKEEYGENYSIVREQGLTIYISGSNAAWVNGGLVYKIKAVSGTLTNKQIRSIATSL